MLLWFVRPMVLRCSFPFCLLRLVFRDDEVFCVLHLAATRWVGGCPDQGVFRTRPAEYQYAQGNKASCADVSADGPTHEPGRHGQAGSASTAQWKHQVDTSEGRKSFAGGIGTECSPRLEVGKGRPRDHGTGCVSLHPVNHTNLTSLHFPPREAA